MSKKGTEPFDICMGFSLLCFVILLILVCANAISIPQGTWECVEWEEEVYVEYSSWIDCTNIESETPYLCISYTVIHNDLYEFEEFVKTHPNFNNDIEVKTRQGNCIKEQLIREVNL